MRPGPLAALVVSSALASLAALGACSDEAKTAPDATPPASTTPGDAGAPVDATP